MRLILGLLLIALAFGLMGGLWLNRADLPFWTLLVGWAGAVVLILTTVLLGQFPSRLRRRRRM